MAGSFRTDTYRRPVRPEDISAQKRFLTQKNKRLLLAILCRNTAAYTAYGPHLTTENWMEVSPVFAVVWQAVKNCFQQYEELPGDARQLAAEIDAVIEAEPNLFETENQHDEVAQLVTQIFDPNQRQEIATDPQYYKRAGEYVRLLKLELTNRAFSSFLGDPIVGVMPESPASVAHHMAETFMQIEAIGKDVDTTVFSEDWDIDELPVIRPSGHELIDYMMGGEGRGEVNTFLGPFGSCKTTFAISATLAAATQIQLQEAQGLTDSETPGSPVCFYASYEADLEEFQRRVLSCEALIPYWRFQEAKSVRNFRADNNPNLLDYEKKLFAEEIASNQPVRSELQRYKDAVAKVNKYIRFLDFSGKRKNAATGSSAVGSGHVQELAAQISSVCRSQNVYPYVVWVDHASAMSRLHMQSPGCRYKDEHQCLSDVIMLLGRLIAKPHQTPCWILHQLSGQQNQKGSTATITHAHAKGCAGFAEYADNAITTTIPNDSSICVWEITKHRRSGPKPPAFVQVDGEFGRVINRSNVYMFENNRRSIVSIADHRRVRTARTAQASTVNPNGGVADGAV